MPACWMQVFRKNLATSFRCHLAPVSCPQCSSPDWARCGPPLALKTASLVADGRISSLSPTVTTMGRVILAAKLIPSKAMTVASAYGSYSGEWCR
jgi:hypothetical protein